MMENGKYFEVIWVTSSSEAMQVKEELDSEATLSAQEEGETIYSSHCSEEFEEEEDENVDVKPFATVDVMPFVGDVEEELGEEEVNEDEESSTLEVKEEFDSEVTLTADGERMDPAAPCCAKIGRKGDEQMDVNPFAAVDDSTDVGENELHSTIEVKEEFDSEATLTADEGERNHFATVNDTQFAGGNEILKSSKERELNSGPEKYYCSLSQEEPLSMAAFQREPMCTSFQKISTGGYFYSTEDFYEQKEFICRFCNIEFKERKLLKQHMRMHYKCSLCGKGFTTYLSRDRHMITHSRNYPHKCDQCGKGCLTKAGLEAHVRVHTGEKPFKCDVCGNCFIHNGSLIIHMRLHSGNRPYICDVCGKGFTVRAHLITHSKSHSSERPFKCEVCEKAFALNKNLKAHMKSHARNRAKGKEKMRKKAFRCQLCQKAYRLSGSLAKHMSCHTGERPHLCERCGTRFTIKSHLVQHMRVHSENKPYECNVCGVRFTRRSTQLKHMSKHS